jgi:hypothetical protein
MGDCIDPSASLRSSLRMTTRVGSAASQPAQNDRLGGLRRVASRRGSAQPLGRESRAAHKRSCARPAKSRFLAALRLRSGQANSPRSQARLRPARNDNRMGSRCHARTRSSSHVSSRNRLAERGAPSSIGMIIDVGSTTAACPCSRRRSWAASAGSGASSTADYRSQKTRSYPSARRRVW